MNNQIQFEVNALLRMASLLDENSTERKIYIERANLLLSSQRDEKEIIKQKLSQIPRWIVENKPKKGRNLFISYAQLCQNVFGYVPNRPSDVIKESLENSKIELYIAFGIGVQFGAKSNDSRGIRIYAS